MCNSKINLHKATITVPSPTENIPYSPISEMEECYEEHYSLVLWFDSLLGGHSQVPVNKLTERPYKPIALISLIALITVSSYPSLHVTHS